MTMKWSHIVNTLHLEEFIPTTSGNDSPHDLVHGMSLKKRDTGKYSNAVVKLLPVMPAFQMGIEREVEQLGLEPASTWDAAAIHSLVIHLGKPWVKAQILEPLLPPCEAWWEY